jgi:hypothetical protein
VRSFLALSSCAQSSFFCSSSLFAGASKSLPCPRMNSKATDEAEGPGRTGRWALWEGKGGIRRSHSPKIKKS